MAPTKSVGNSPGEIRTREYGANRMCLRSLKMKSKSPPKLTSSGKSLKVQQERRTRKRKATDGIILPTRTPRKLTDVRKRRVSEFMRKAYTANEPRRFGNIGSLRWITELITFLKAGGIHNICRSDVQRWINKESTFFVQAQFEASRAGQLPLPNAEDIGYPEAEPLSPSDSGICPSPPPLPPTRQGQSRGNCFLFKGQGNKLMLGVRGSVPNALQSYVRQFNENPPATDSSPSQTNDVKNHDRSSGQEEEEANNSTAHQGTGKEGPQAVMTNFGKMSADPTSSTTVEASTSSKDSPQTPGDQDQPGQEGTPVEGKQNREICLFDPSVAGGSKEVNLEKLQQSIEAGAIRPTCKTVKFFTNFLRLMIKRARDTRLTVVSPSEVEICLTGLDLIDNTIWDLPDEE